MEDKKLTAEEWLKKFTKPPMTSEQWQEAATKLKQLEASRAKIIERLPRVFDRAFLEREADRLLNQINELKKSMGIL